MRKQNKKLTNPEPTHEKVTINTKPTTVFRRRSPKLNTVFNMQKKIYPDGRKDEDSQTEEIFFKM